MKPGFFNIVFALSLFYLGVMTLVWLLNPVAYATDKSSVGRVYNPMGQTGVFSFVV